MRTIAHARRPRGLPSPDTNRYVPRTTTHYPLWLQTIVVKYPIRRRRRRVQYSQVHEKGAERIRRGPKRIRKPYNGRPVWSTEKINSVFQPVRRARQSRFKHCVRPDGRVRKTPTEKPGTWPRTGGNESGDRRYVGPSGTLHVYVDATDRRQASNQCRR